MKAVLVSYTTGEMAIELIAESEAEQSLLTNAWRVMESGHVPYRGNGRTVTDRGSTGFYLPATLGAHPDERKRRWGEGDPA